MTANGHAQQYDDVTMHQAPHIHETEQPVDSAPAHDYNGMIFILNEWRKILNTRLLALLALSGSLFGFGFAMYDPTPLRLWAMGIYAVLVQAPVLLLALRKG